MNDEINVVLDIDDRNQIFSFYQISCIVSVFEVKLYFLWEDYQADMTMYRIYTSNLFSLLILFKSSQIIHSYPSHVIITRHCLLLSKGYV